MAVGAKGSIARSELVEGHAAFMRVGCVIGKSVSRSFGLRGQFRGPVARLFVDRTDATGGYRREGCEM